MIGCNDNLFIFILATESMGKSWSIIFVSGVQTDNVFCFVYFVILQRRYFYRFSQYFIE